MRIVAMTTNMARTTAHELHGYAPWYFGMPLGKEYDVAIRYRCGKGLSVEVDGKTVATCTGLGRVDIKL